MRETIGEYEGYTITVSNPEKIEKAKKSWLNFVIVDLENKKVKKRKMRVYYEKSINDDI